MVQAPVTAILIVFEMTHQFALIPGLMLGGLVSQMIARSMNRSNFHEAVLLQGGHQLEHIIPPRDLRSWQNLPVSAIAHFDPVVIRDLSDVALKETLGRYPYRYFPVVEDGKLKGIVARSEMEASIDELRPVRLDSAVTSRPGAIIRDVQQHFIESSTGFIVLSENPGGSKQSRKKHVTTRSKPPALPAEASSQENTSLRHHTQ